jgi:hypothetical protein
MYVIIYGSAGPVYRTGGPDWEQNMHQGTSSNYKEIVTISSIWFLKLRGTKFKIIVIFLSKWHTITIENIIKGKSSYYIYDSI